MFKKHFNRKLYISVILIVFIISQNKSQNSTNRLSISSSMKNTVLSNKGELLITPSATSSATDFNFLVGSHSVHHKKLASRLTSSKEWIEFDGTHHQELILNGIGNLEQHQMNALDGKPLAGMALRLFDPETKLWSIYWSDSRSGKLDTPMKGSFENGVGYFFSKDNYNGKPILVQFKWDASDPNNPVWSQAFSLDAGKSWEWNWYMYFTKMNPVVHQAVKDTMEKDPGLIGTIELRNYLLKPGKQDAFIEYFETNFIQSQEKLNGFPLGQYKISGSEDHFFWIRGFENMKSRSLFLPSFYYGDFWKAHRNAANSMIVNNDNVHLLQPLQLQNDSLVIVGGIKKELLYPKNRVAVVDFYIANTKLEQLKQTVAKHYIPLLNACDIHSYTIWQAELTENDFPKLPVFQDKNLLVIITFYNNEEEYRKKIKLRDSKMSDQLRDEWNDGITVKTSVVLYPTARTMKQ